jgi:hypothetical protein
VLQIGLHLRRSAFEHKICTCVCLRARACACACACKEKEKENKKENESERANERSIFGGISLAVAHCEMAHVEAQLEDCNQMTQRAKAADELFSWTSSTDTHRWRCVVRNLDIYLRTEEEKMCKQEKNPARGLDIGVAL